MKILVINCGSSSIKYKLYEMDDRSVLAPAASNVWDCPVLSSKLRSTAKR